MTRAEDIALASELGVDMIGLIFFLDSPRSVSIQQAQLILKNMPSNIKTVAVFVNPSVQFVDDAINHLPINYLQFHGEESPNFCQQFEMPYIKAIPANSTERMLKSAARYGDAHAILLDTPSVKVRGGSGLSFDWNMIPENLPQPIMLAGGLSPRNVRTAVSHKRIYAVDVCSGVEHHPGVKDPLKMKQFVNALKDKS